MFAPGTTIDPYSIRTPSNAPPPSRRIDLNENAVRVDVRTLAGKRVLVFVSVGQSNAANMSLGYLYSITHVGKVLHLDPANGALYAPTADPCYGATGTAGTWLFEMADNLITAGTYDYVIVVGITAIGGIAIEYLAPGSLGFLNHRFDVVQARLRDIGLTPSVFNLRIGESAIGYPEASFRNPMDAMIASVQARGMTQPWLIDISTYHNDIINTGAVAACTNIVNGTDILAGVDTDDLTYGTGHRLLEGGAKVHFNELGCNVMAARKSANIIANVGLIPLGLVI